MVSDTSNCLIGIDIGSKTLKIVIANEDGKILHKLYWRHRTNVRSTLLKAFENLSGTYKNVAGRVCVTGSAGIGVANALNLPFVQEVIATTKAVKCKHKGADAFIELGGEDAKVVYLGSYPEQRMNATCAGGTGGFIDTIAYMLGVSTSDMDRLARQGQNIYKIAARCAVFAQTDIRPLLNAGVSKKDLALSTLDAVVRQTLGGLACGRKLEGTIVFLGGPFEYLPTLAKCFKEALSLSEKDAIRPQNAHLYTALGAALSSLEYENNEFSIRQLYSLVSQCDSFGDDIAHLSSLFDNEKQYDEFKERINSSRMPRVPAFKCKGPLYLGFDAGSTTCKYALLDSDAKLAYSDCRSVKGNTLDTAIEMLKDLYKLLYLDEDTYICQSVAIGYGAKMIKAALGLDADIVETFAHFRSAYAYKPDVSFVLDIGGQDMKALWVKDGQITDAVLNEACSSGCGSFIEGSAHSLHISLQRFNDYALKAKNPIDLGTRCTVFMSSRLKHAQKIGTGVDDIAAGIAYSVVNNVLNRLIGNVGHESMGDVIVVQGGGFCSDAVLRAFEKLTNKQVYRPDTSQLMGAIGAALIARDTVITKEKFLQKEHLNMDMEGAQSIRSKIISEDELRALNPKRIGLICEGCPNACKLVAIDFGSKIFVSGNKCEKGEHIAKDAIKLNAAKTKYEKNGATATAFGSLQAHDFDDLLLSKNIDSNKFALYKAQNRKNWSVPKSAGKSPEAKSAGKGVEAKSAELKNGETKSAAAKNTASSSVKNPYSKNRFAMSNMQPENILLEQFKELENFGAHTKKVSYPGVRIALITDFSGNELRPFWFSIFSFLGFHVVEPPHMNCDFMLNEHEKDNAELDKLCAPLKIASMRLNAYVEAGANCIFAPRFEKGNLCSLANQLNEEVFTMNSFTFSGIKILRPFLSSAAPSKISYSNTDTQELINSITELVPDGSLSRNRVLDAIRLAVQSQAEFDRVLLRHANKALYALNSNAQQGVCLATCAQSYSKELLENIANPAQKLDFSVLNYSTLNSYKATSSRGSAAHDPRPLVEITKKDLVTPKEYEKECMRLSENQENLNVLLLEPAQDICFHQGKDCNDDGDVQFCGKQAYSVNMDDVVIKESKNDENSSVYTVFSQIKNDTEKALLDKSKAPVGKNVINKNKVARGKAFSKATVKSMSKENAVDENFRSEGVFEQSCADKQSNLCWSGLKQIMNTPSAFLSNKNAGNAGDAFGKGANANKADCGSINAAQKKADDADFGLRTKKEQEYDFKNSVPNGAAFMQRKISSFSDVSSSKRNITIGITSTLLQFETTPFWHTLFSALGFGVCCASKKASDDVLTQAAQSIASESVCSCAKISHARIYALKSAGADAIFLPRFARDNNCPVMCDYSKALIDSIDFLRKKEFFPLSFKLSKLSVFEIAKDANQLEILLDSLNELIDFQRNGLEESARTDTCCTDGPNAPDLINKKELELAINIAIKAQEEFDSSIKQFSDATLEWLESDETHTAALLVGRPYHIDEALLHGIDKEITDLNMGIIVAHGIEEHVEQYASAGAQVSASARASADFEEADYFLKFARFVKEHNSMALVALHSFGCGFYDVAAIALRDTLSASKNIPFCILKIDEIIDTAHIRIRLQTMAQSVFNNIFKEKKRSLSMKLLEENTSTSKGENNNQLEQVNIFEEQLSQEDLFYARKYVSNGICFTAAICAARSMRIMEKYGNNITIHVPLVCQKCVLSSIDFLVKRKTGATPHIIWEDASSKQLVPPLNISNEPLQEVDTSIQKKLPDNNASVSVGIVGNALLCFDKFMNENLAALLYKLNAEPVWPDPALLYTDDVTYTEQLDLFEKQDVDIVLYLQSFGCLKGHVCSRGVHNMLMKKYPHMPVHVLDYDPESSALNRENRIRLAVEAAFDAKIKRAHNE